MMAVKNFIVQAPGKGARDKHSSLLSPYESYEENKASLQVKGIFDFFFFFCFLKVVDVPQKLHNGLNNAMKVL